MYITLNTIYARKYSICCGHALDMYMPYAPSNHRPIKTTPLLYTSPDFPRDLSPPAQAVPLPLPLPLPKAAHARTCKFHCGVRLGAVELRFAMPAGTCSAGASSRRPVVCSGLLLPKPHCDLCAIIREILADQLDSTLHASSYICI
jgi:hypothetical protein